MSKFIMDDRNRIGSASTGASWWIPGSWNASEQSCQGAFVTVGSAISCSIGRPLSTTIYARKARSASSFDVRGSTPGLSL